MLQPVALRPHYARFLTPGRVLLTGHSHQAWPDAAREGQLEAFDDAAAHVDDKWPRAFEAADAVRAYVGRCLDVAPKQIALGQNTHELVLRMLSACPVRPRLVTTTGEFHSITRQLRRLKGVLDVVWVDARPVATLSERLIAAVDERCAAVLTSTVLFETSERVPGLDALVKHARGIGAEVLLDAYHAFGVVPFTVGDLDAFFVGGGYKYAQWGEGVCWMRVPPREFKPLVTGWYAGFADLERGARGGDISWGESGAEQFAGSTYDPTSHYRARAVIRFFVQQGLTLQKLRELSVRQTSRLIDALEGLDVATPREPDARGGFVAVRLPNAHAIVEQLRAQNIWCDSRGELLRLGPAPYLLDEELDRGVALLRKQALQQR
jgi:kynureninase